MNKIYKVIWSKVKHQYVVVSELAHSNGKQSRTAKKSLRSRIAALVVCGAIAAFGVYGALPVQQAFAADDKVQQATQTQYVAFKANRNSDEWQQGYQKIYSESDKIWITFRPQTVTLSDGRELYYWVREGYTLEPQENVQYIPDRLMDTQWTDGIKPNFTMSAEITDPEKIKGSVLKTTESNSVGTKATTTRGESLETVEVGHYTGVSNSEGVETGYDWNYIIDPVGNGNQSQYIDIKAAIPEGKNNVWDSGYLKAVEQIGDNYYLADTNRTVKVDPDNIYIINNKAGVFVTTPNKDSYTEKDIYTGRVYGAHNEILMTSKDDNGQYYTYWAGKVNDDENVLLSDSNLTLGDYRDQIDTFYRNDGKLAAADIKSVELDSKNKSINLITNTKFDENGNPIEGTEETIQGFTVSKTTSQTNGKGNAQIKFSQKDAEGNETSSFVVDAGSIVKANEETSASDETLTSLSVDGTNYKLSQGKTYTKGSGIIVDNTDNTISVDLAKDGDKNISGLHFNATGQLANNLKVTDYVSPTPTENPSQNKDGGNWTITETDGQGLNRELTNTTLDTSASANWNTGTDSLITGAIIAKNNNVENPNEVADATTEYGRNYKVIDTNGNIVELDDVASASKLRDVANNANDAQTEAKKHTIVSTKDENLGVENVGANGAAANYEISLKDKVVLGEGQGAIILNGQNKDEALLNVGNKLVIDQDGTTTIIADDGINNRPGQTQITPDTTVTISPDGVTFAGDDRGTTIIEGQKITAGGIVINGEDIYDETLGTTVKGTIKGLSNTTWNGTTTTPDRAATEGQLQTVSDKADEAVTEAGKHTIVSTKDENLGVENVGANGAAANYEISLKDKVVLGEGQGAIILNGQNKDEALLNVGNKLVIDQDGTTTIVANDGIDNRPGQTQITPDTTVTIAPSGVTFTGDDKGTTIIEGQKITAGGIVINGEDVYDETLGTTVKGTITGLSNTTWDGTTDNESRVATEGQLEDLSDTVNTGWYVADKNTAEDSTTGNFAVKPGETLTFNGDDNIDVEAKDHEVNVSLNDNITLGEGNSQININGNPENGEAALSIGDKFVVEQNGTTTIVANDGIDNRPGQTQITPDTTVTIAPSGVTFTGDDKGTTIIEGQKITAGGIVINGEDVYDETLGTTVKGTITGLSNTTWDGKTDNASRVATEGQLEDLSDTVNTGWIATDGTTEVNVNPANNTLKFAGDNNITVTADSENNAINVKLNPVVTLDGNESDNNKVVLDGNNGTINATNTVKYGKGQGPGRTITNEFTFDNKGATFTSTTEKGHHDPVESSTNINGGTITTDTVKGLDNTTWNENIAKAVAEDKELQGVAATQGQLQTVDSKVNAGWIATDSQNHEVKITPDNNKLNFAGDENVTVTAANNEIKVALNDDIALGEYLNNGAGVLIGGSSGTISATNSITVGEDQGLIIDGQKKEIQGLSNTTWNEKIANDAAVEGSTAASTAATQGQLQEVSKVANAGWTASDGTNSISVKPNETLNFVGDENLTVSADGTDKELKVSLNDDITLGDGENAIKIDGTDGTLNIGSTFAVAEDGTVLSDGDVIADADGEKYSLSEVGKYAVRYDKTNDGTSTITLVDGDDLSGTRIKNVADGVDPKDAVNVSQLEAVEATANAGWTASDGTNSISIKPNETLNFVGDENLTVSADGTDKKLKVSLNDNITLGDKESTSITLYTDPTSETTVVGTDGNTTNVTGYVPESYKSGTGADFVKNNGGFALFTTDTQGHGIFGVTTKGTAHGKDFVTYTKDIYGNDTRYSLNDVGDAVTQMSSYYNEENGKSYTVFSRYLNEAEKDNPFATVDENATRDIPLALRDDGAVLIGATIKGDDFTDNGIRINAETETTYDGDGNEVTNNIATITGLENTEWKPPTPVATFAANDINTTSRAATEAQLDDLYSAVAAYDVNVDGTIDYSHIALAGTPYGASRSGNGTHTGGTSITNVAYASGKDGSEAVNVDYLNDAISDAAENGSISTSDQHLVANTETGSNGVYKPNDDGNVNLIVSDEKGNSSTITIGDVASKEDLDNLKDDVGDLDYSKVEGDTIIDGDSVTDAIGKLDNKIDNITGTATDADNNTVTGGKINSDGTISLTQKDKDSIKLEGQLTDSGVVQEGTSFDKETGTITITSQDKYSGETSSVKVEGIASTEVVGATNKEDLATAYKDADKDGNATTEYITDSESMVEADVALDHAIQDVAGTSYANDMVLSNRIDSVEKRLGNVEERIDKVGAMAAAIANLRTMGFDPEAPTEIAIGVGQYKSETGIAIGVFHYPNQDFMLSASLSSSGDELMGGIGATWKLGRKSAAERVKDEEARHLEQAEEMKKLAQQEKVKAQAQRHAKLLAERQQASQKNA